MKKKLIAKVIEKLGLTGKPSEKVVSDGLVRMTSEGLEALAVALGVEVEAKKE